MLSLKISHLIRSSVKKGIKGRVINLGFIYKYFIRVILESKHAF